MPDSPIRYGARFGSHEPGRKADTFHRLPLFIHFYAIAFFYYLYYVIEKDRENKQ